MDIFLGELLTATITGANSSLSASVSVFSVVAGVVVQVNGEPDVP